MPTADAKRVALLTEQESLLTEIAEIEARAGLVVGQKKRRIAAITEELSQLKRQRAQSLERSFVDAARATLEPDVFRQIMNLAQSNNR